MSFAREQDAGGRYKDLVDQIANGERVNAATVESILDAAKKTAGDLHNSVSTKKRRMAERAKRDTIPDLQLSCRRITPRLRKPMRC